MVGLKEVPSEEQEGAHMGAKSGPRAAVLKLLNLRTTFTLQKIVEDSKELSLHGLCQYLFY